VRDNESDRATATPVEGVRILGAKETPSARGDDRDDNRDVDRSVDRDVDSAAIDLSRIDSDEPEPQSSFTHRAPVPIVASTDDADEHEEPPASEPPSGEMPPLPHWTEPPTGAVPAIFADDTGEQPVDEDLDAWAPITGSTPRFRAEGSDWAEADFGEDLSGEQERLGALSEAEPVDEDAEFAAALAQRRRRMPRGPRAARRPRPRPPPRRRRAGRHDPNPMPRTQGQHRRATCPPRS
jgi:phosphatidate cytidylyltransferase